MGIRFTRLTRLAAAAAGAALLFTAAACGTQNTADTETKSDPDTSSKATGPINVVASINQWGSLAAELGGDDVNVTSIMSSTNVDAHDFEPKTSDVAKLSKAQIVVANGAGYDAWATKSLTKSTTIVSAASVVGAMEGDNPHLWFSKDARSGMATEITEAYIKALPSKKADFQKRLKEWQAGEKQLESWAEDFTKTHDDLTYAATEPVAYYLMADLGFEDSTPKGYAQSQASGGEVAPADLQSFQKIIEGRKVDVLLNNTQETSDATNMITGTAGRSDVPVVDVTEQMPTDSETLDDWINQLVNTIIDAVDPSYGCEDTSEGEADSSDADAADASTDGESSDGTDGDGQSADAGDSTDSSGESTDSNSSSTDSKTRTYIRECKATKSGTSKDDQSTDDSQNNTDSSTDSQVPSNEGQTDPGK
ncbi:metal ABC transporter solute-binding protein [Bifidobacterium miconisargentati]|uniref:metal ABC transporter solute-binding protein n=1 Tax=Bifidobacterium miconisargentati TaxID=2834437 RepID=UPI001BDBF994|nr:metal ABC transporter solute-binding protein [Bifidobacterium miconisargentati]MBW3089264.1 metal ABC transporter solute-binding protein [Bifidobacterium miconisargentati]